MVKTLTPYIGFEKVTKVLLPDYHKDLTAYRAALKLVFLTTELLDWPGHGGDV
jgi:hypothetical protein